jgi:CheY-like chemotaxis protein
MAEMQILFVEDETTQLQLFTDAVEEWNAAHPDRLLNIVHAATVADAHAMLANMRIDAALFDLRLPPSEGEKGTAKGGNDLVTTSLREVGVPVGIISGNPADFDTSIAASELVDIFNKGDVDVYAAVVAWLDSKWLLMAVLASARRQIQSSGAEIFVKRLWPRWQTYAGLTGADQEELTRIVTRQYVGHIAEALGLDGNGNAPWHPYECFIHPALLEHRAQTGDVFTVDGEPWVILTPACDMATKKVKLILLARIRSDGGDDWKKNIALLGQEGLSKSQTDARDRYFLKLVRQNVDGSEHFLPPLGEGGPMMVQFKELRTLELSWLNDNLEARAASIAPAFLANLVQRFGAYISRTGQPNIDIRHFG